MAVRVQEADFDVGAELDRLTAGNKKIGGLAVFVGLVREMHVREGYHKDRVDALTLEHYPGMTERAIEAMIVEAEARFAVQEALVIHRVGRLLPGERIVLVAVCSSHRRDAFQACEFLMDYLKTQAPFWKKETTGQGERWVDARVADDEALGRWGLTSGNAAASPVTAEDAAADAP